MPKTSYKFAAVVDQPNAGARLVALYERPEDALQAQLVGTNPRIVRVPVELSRNSHDIMDCIRDADMSQQSIAL